MEIDDRPTRSSRLRSERRRKLGNRLGYLGLTLALLALGGALSFRFPEFLTTQELRAIYPVGLLRAVLGGGLALAILLSAASALLQPRRPYGWTGLCVAGLAVLCGGSWIVVEEPVRPSRAIGLDWLVLDFFGAALVFVPLERFFLRRAQAVFREGWRTDLLHYATSHLLIGVTVVAITAPAYAITRVLGADELRAFVVGLPLVVQVIATIVVADGMQYAVHRAFHQIPLLWRFHAIHHSSRQMDWLAGSRLHLVDIVLTRGLTLVPLALAGFSDAALQIYLVFIALHAVFVHSNVRFELRPVAWLLATPAYHHWHHSAEIAPPGCNFAVSVPLIDRLFGTHHLPPGEWPPRYGIDGDPVPDDFLGQVVSPFIGRTP